MQFIEALKWNWVHLGACAVMWYHIMRYDVMWDHMIWYEFIYLLYEFL